MNGYSASMPCRVGGPKMLRPASTAPDYTHSLATAEREAPRDERAEAIDPFLQAPAAAIVFRWQPFFT
jgi:hypothetical protein